MSFKNAYIRSSLRNKKNKCLIISIILLILSLNYLSEIPYAVAITDSFTEDFTSTTYRDAGNTNVTGWGDGQIINPKKNITHVGTCATPDRARDVFISGNYAYIANLYAGLSIINITDPTKPILVTTINTPDSAEHVLVEGDYAYVPSSWGQVFEIYDISDPSNPILAGSYSTTSLFIDDFFISGNYAYLTVGRTSREGLEVVDISDPTNPVYAGMCSSPDLHVSTDVFVTGNYAYVVNFTTLGVFDVSNPTNPSLVSLYPLSTELESIFISGVNAYIAARNDGLLVVNITNPTNPILLGSCITPTAFEVYISSDFAYVVDLTDGLIVIDISNPKNPVIVNSYDTPDSASGVFVDGNYAYIADQLGGLQIYKISDPISPTYAGSFSNPDYAKGVYVEGDYAFIADYDNGLYIANIIILLIQY